MKNTVCNNVKASGSVFSLMKFISQICEFKVKLMKYYKLCKQSPDDLNAQNPVRASGMIFN